MKKFLFLYLILFSTASIAQRNLDSLLTIWKDPSRSNYDRINAYSKYIKFGHLFSKPDSAAQLAEALHVYANKHNYSKASSNGYNIQGVSSSIQGKYDLALGYYEKGIAIDKELGNDIRVGNALSNIGLIYNTQGNYSRALEFFQKSLTFFGNNRVSGKGNALNNIGMIHLSQENDSLALVYFEMSLAIREELGDKTGISNSLGNIGVINRRQGNYQQALQYYQKSLEIAQKLGDKNVISRTHVNIGDLYDLQGDYSKALEQFKKGLKIAEEMGDDNTRAMNLNNIGTEYTKQGKYELAINYCQTSLALAKEIGLIEVQQKSCECLYDTYKLTGNDRKALEYFEQMTIYKDSMFNEENTKKLTQLQMQFEFDKKEAATQAEQEKKDALATQELERQKLVRNGFMGGFTVVLLFAGVFFIQRNKIGKEKERSDELLLNILPEEVAAELKEKGHSDAQLIDQVTVLFTDFKGFTTLSEKITPKELVKDLHECFSAFDSICEKYDIEKIKTIGDAYMAAGGLPSPNKTHAQDVVNAALEMAEVIEKGKAKKIAQDLPFFEVRIGVHTGPVVAGIVGVKKFQYDIWGDTVNTASRMESNSEVGKVNVSQTTYELIKDQFNCEYRGEIEAKGKGKLKMFFASKI